jgi:hypothetical protein
MPRADALPVDRIIANTINKTARGDPDALAARIVAALGEAGYRIVPANGREDTARSTNERRMEQLYRSPTATPGSSPTTPPPARPSSGIRRMRRRAVR